MRKSSPKREFKDYLLDIAYSIERIEKFVEGFDFDLSTVMSFTCPLDERECMQTRG